MVLESDHTYTILKPLGFCLKITRIGKTFTHLLIFGFYFVFKLKLKYRQAKYEENMTEASSKGVMRLKPTMFLFVRLVCIWMSGCQAQEQKVEKLITALQDQIFF